MKGDRTSRTKTTITKWTQTNVASSFTALGVKHKLAGERGLQMVE